MAEMSHYTPKQNWRWLKWVITTPSKFGNGRNESYNPQANLEMAKMSHYNAKQFWKWPK